MRKAVDGLLNFSQSALGEEVLEGVIGGGLASSPIVFSDASPEEKALAVLLSMGGGVGIGMAGRRIGASIGKSLHPNAISDQDGMLSMIGRMMGQERVTQGVKEQMAAMSKQMGSDMKSSYISNLKLKAMTAPQEVATELGITAAEVPSVMKQLDMLDEIISTGAKKKIPEMGKAIQETGRKIQDGSIGKIPEAAQPFGKIMEELGEGFSMEASPVTGEHLGRAFGRAAGDEIGILAGLGSASLISQQMGFESEQDRKVRKLNERIKELGG